jgi:NAD+ synthase
MDIRDKQANMAETFRITLAQMNPTVGDIAGNIAKARRAWHEGRDAGADLVALTEMFVTGYQPQDLILKPAFADAAIAAIGSLAVELAEGPALGIGGPARHGGRLHNAYYILQSGRIHATVLKHHLPNTDVFDERRVFSPADVTGPYRLGPIRIGTPICEDSWHPDVAETLAETGAEILLVPNGSPYHRGKPDTRLNLMVARVIETGLPLIYLNMVGGQDDQVFDGASIVLNPGGELAVQMPQFEECITHIDLERGASGWRCKPGIRTAIPEIWEADYHACVLSLRDYLRKCGFGKVLLGLSGGIDSAIVATIAADALGPENVHCVMLPSRYTSADLPGWRMISPKRISSRGCAA